MYIVEHDEIKDNLRIVVIFGSHGFRCGYVGVDASHPFYKLQYNNYVPIKFARKMAETMRGEVGKRGALDVFCTAIGERPLQIGFLFDVHGSITYSEGNNYPTHNEDGKWWFFGFDCAHHGDAKDYESAEKYGFKMYPEYDFHYGEVREFDYALQECYSLAKQLSEIKEA